jgi:hypothetical protein
MSVSGESSDTVFAASVVLCYSNTTCHGYDYLDLIKCIILLLHTLLPINKFVYKLFELSYIPRRDDLFRRCS